MDFNFEELNEYLLSKKGKIIHQVWFKFSSKSDKLYESLRYLRNSWSLKNPDWTYIVWNEKRSVDLIKTHYPEHLELYRSYDYNIQRCDMIRFFILYHYGGLYADTDYYCNQPFSSVLRKYPKDFYFVETHPSNSISGVNVSNSLMYSVPKHIFWKKVFIELEKAKEQIPWYYSRHLTIMYTTGPAFLNRVFTKYKNIFNLHSFPYRWFHPFGLKNDIKLLQNLDSKVYAAHLGYGSWEKEDSKILVFLYANLGMVLFIILTLIIPYLLYR